MLTLTPSEYKQLQQRTRAGVLPKLAALPTAKAKGVQRRRGEQTTEERLFGEYMETQRIGGKVLWYEFEPIRLVLAHVETVRNGKISRSAVTYCPDWCAMRADGVLCCFEVKGTKLITRACGAVEAIPYVLDDAAVKLKLAASLFPFVFHLVHRLKSGEWAQIDY